MKLNKLSYKLISIALILFFTSFQYAFSQKSIQNISLSKAKDLYQTSNYIAAEKMFQELKGQYNANDPIIFDLDITGLCV